MAGKVPKKRVQGEIQFPALGDEVSGLPAMQGKLGPSWIGKKHRAADGKIKPLGMTSRFYLWVDPGEDPFILDEVEATVDSVQYRGVFVEFLVAKRVVSSSREFPWSVKWARRYRSEHDLESPGGEWLTSDFGGVATVVRNLLELEVQKRHDFPGIKADFEKGNPVPWPIS